MFLCDHNDFYCTLVLNKNIRKLTADDRSTAALKKRQRQDLFLQKKKLISYLHILT